MTPKQQILNREQLRKLNVELNQIFKTMKTNQAAGVEYSQEYKQWVAEKVSLRDSLIEISA